MLIFETFLSKNTFCGARIQARNLTSFFMERSPKNVTEYLNNKIPRGSIAPSEDSRQNPDPMSTSEETE